MPSYDQIKAGISIYTIDRSVVEASNFNRAESSLQIFPNPAENLATIRFSLLEESDTHAEIVDILGNEVKKIFNERLLRGAHQYKVVLDDLSPGIYFCKLTGSNIQSTQKLVALK